MYLVILCTNIALINFLLQNVVAKSLRELEQLPICDTVTDIRGYVEHCINNWYESKRRVRKVKIKSS